MISLRPLAQVFAHLLLVFGTQIPLQDAYTPSVTSQANNDAKAVVERFCKLETEGGRLTSEGWRQARIFFARSTPFALEKKILVIGKPYTVWDPMVLPGGVTSVTVEIDPIGRIDSKLRFEPPSHDFYKNARQFRLTFTDKRQEAGAKGNPGKEVIDSSPHWLIDEPDDLLMLSITSAIQFLTQQRDATSDAVLKKNADEALAKLTRFR